MYRIKTFNKIAPAGLARFSPESYTVSDALTGENAILVRSAKLLDYPFPDSLLAISRAGAGVNNIPIDRCSASGVAVFSTPGANANAVKELVLCAMLMGSRDVNGAIGFAAVTTAERVGAKCILAPTNSGRTARLIADFRPKLPLYAFSPSEKTIRKTSFYWGVRSFHSTTMPSLNATVKQALQLAKEKGLVETGDLVVVTAGDPGTSPTQGDYTTSTNMVLVCQIQ